MRFILYALISYISLYVVIWLHEVGHGFFYWLYGCKKNMFHVKVTPYIFYSTPLPIDLDKASKLSTEKNILISYGGIIMNALWVIISAIILHFIPVENEYVTLYLWCFMTLHLAEFISYMMIGNIVLVSDMLSIASLKPELRWPNFAIGCIVMIGYILMLLKIPCSINRWEVIGLNLLTIFCMCYGRITFTLKNNKQSE